MRAISASLDTHIRVNPSDLGEEITEEIKDALSIRNEAKENARREKLKDWELLPDHIILWRYDDLGHLVLPRGFKDKFEDGLTRSGIEIAWNDCRSSVWMDSEYLDDLTPISLRDHQIPAVEAILEREQGIYQAPPGSGKTVTILEAIRNTAQRAIILTDKANLAQQWRDRAESFLGVPTGLIGDGVFDPGEITVALKQTLWSRREELKEQGFFEEWGFVAYDECHHVTAETYQFVVQQFCPKYLIGVSATPAREPWTFPIAVANIGPIIHETPREDLQDKGILVAPKIHVVPTNFEFGFRATKFNSGGYRVGNNYKQLEKHLAENKDRNALIASLICAEPKRHVLVVSKRLKHLDSIGQALKDAGYQYPIFNLTGKESRQERMSVAQLINEHYGVVLSTIADEALDIPRLDTIILSWPTRNISVVRQQIGRVERAAEDKNDAKVYDLFDQHVGVLKNQFAERMRGVYRAEELEIQWL